MKSGVIRGPSLVRPSLLFVSVFMSWAVVINHTCVVRSGDITIDWQRRGTGVNERLWIIKCLSSKALVDQLTAWMANSHAWLQWNANCSFCTDNHGRVASKLCSTDSYNLTPLCLYYSYCSFDWRIPVICLFIIRFIHFVVAANFCNSLKPRCRCVS